MVPWPWKARLFFYLRNGRSQPLFVIGCEQGFDQLLVQTVLLKFSPNKDWTIAAINAASAKGLAVACIAKQAEFLKLDHYLADNVRQKPALQFGR